jgi:hypothetical protein
MIKAKARADRTLHEVASDLNVPLGTLKGWLKQQGKEKNPLTAHLYHFQSTKQQQPGVQHNAWLR